MANRFVSAIVGIALFSLTASVSTASTRPKSLEEQAWDIACSNVNQIRLSCRRVSRPLVVSDEHMSNDALGTYLFGTDFVAVDAKIPAHRRMIIIIHEYVHYIQYKNGLRIRDNHCLLEKQAFDISSGVAQKLTLNEPGWDIMKKYYGCAE